MTIKKYLTFFCVFFMGVAFYTLPISASTQPMKADKVIVYKANRTLQLLRNGRVIREYRVALGKNPKGHKIHSGDNRTPEGNYTIAWRNPNSKFHLSINISYPDDIDAEVAESLGLKPGDAIMIHGLPNGISNGAKMGHPYQDWTNGCIAVNNQEMEEIWHMVDDGTPISIWP